jgi:hypothetical protein
MRRLAIVFGYEPVQQLMALLGVGRKAGSHGLTLGRVTRPAKRHFPVGERAEIVMAAIGHSFVIRTRMGGRSAGCV